MVFIFNKLFLQKDVPLDQLSLSDKPVYVAEGFGGRPLKNWPVVNFFRQYATGEYEAARKGYTAWYLAQFHRQRHLPKRVGGMYQGTLYRVIRRQHEAAGRPFSARKGIMSSSIAKKATAIRVEQRLEFLEGIMNSGFCSELSDPPVIGIRRGSRIVLQEGHHRAAAFVAMGKKRMPEMLVFPEKGGLYLYNVVYFFVRIRRILAKAWERITKPTTFRTCFCDFE